LAADLDRLADDVLRALNEGAAATAPALSFLLKRYRATDRADVREALEPALTAALHQPFDRLPPVDRAAYLSAFVEAAAVADDERVLTAIDVLAADLRGERDSIACVDECAAIVEACLAAADVLDPRAIVPDAIDELERVIGAAYRPGQGLAHDLRAPGGPRGRLADHVQAASALLTAYRATARIPYAMLAEELMQFARRTLWDDEAGAFVAAAGTREHPFADNCAAVRVWCRLACLHAEQDYRAAAVIAPEAAYRTDAFRILTMPSVALGARGMASANYGLALTEWLGGAL
jgi:uncharacterized protein YyaL (SSP411 family)